MPIFPLNPSRRQEFPFTGFRATGSSELTCPNIESIPYPYFLLYSKGASVEIGVNVLDEPRALGKSSADSSEHACLVDTPYMLTITYIY